MNLTKTIEVDKLEISGPYRGVHIRLATVIREDGKELSRSFQRHVLNIGDDISNEEEFVRDICNAAWTDELKEAWKQFLIKENNKPHPAWRDPS